MQLATEHEPGTLGSSRAWAIADEVIRGIGEFVDMTVPMEPILRAAGDRIVGRRGVLRTKQRR